MADTPIVTFTDHDGNAYTFFTENLEIILQYDGLTVTRQPGHVGITTDPKQEFRTVTFTTTRTGSEMNSLQTQLMDATKVYDGTDPKLAILYDGSNSWTILVAAMTVRYSLITHNVWRVHFTFIERST